MQFLSTILLLFNAIFMVSSQWGGYFGGYGGYYGGYGGYGGYGLQQAYNVQNAATIGAEVGTAVLNAEEGFGKK
ncbi:unnamed protein product [Caenorhabditis angaria]|uniref:Uncharacterized protein n=1 Tax=Caenorhabditis angaria TaxID=860376 RepID=A0A9P1ISF0_9PELO|nr:unnamed protein product [Caenorhabditis angaria]